MAGPTGTSIEEFIRRIQRGQENALTIAHEEAQDGQKATRVILEQREQPPLEPIRAESQPRAHQFHSVEGFMAYLGKYKTEHTVVLADVENGMFEAVIDEVTEKGREVITFTPIIHPLFQPWLGVLGKMIPLAELTTFLMANRRLIVEPDGRELALMLQQVRASTTVTLHRGRGAKAINGLICETEIKGQRNSEPVDLPETIKLQTPIYVGTDDVEVEADLVLDVVGGGEHVVATLTSADVERAKFEAFETMVAVLQGIEGAVVSLGSANYVEWTYLSHHGDMVSC
ncbi:MAG: DUF2303 family protein [Phycisphaerae bacterium]|nr:DUF2303 family protein [Phycisphaerae bacterium]